MNLPLSSRLLACCDFIKPGDRVADVGCDHGYLGIYLLKSGIAHSVIASDISKGPLQNAVRNAQKFAVKDKMRFYLSRGVESIPHDFDTLVCAGMGADTMISILEAAPWLQSSQYRLILQCQSKRPELRSYLSAKGFSITAETLAQDGKFIYPVMEVVYQPGCVLADWECYISPALLQCNSSLLPAFYDRVIGGLQTTVQGLSRSGGDKLSYYQHILKELLKMEELIHGHRC